MRFPCNYLPRHGRGLLGANSGKSSDDRETRTQGVMQPGLISECHQSHMLKEAFGIAGDLQNEKPKSIVFSRLVDRQLPTKTPINLSDLTI